MCYSVYLSTDSSKDLTVFSTDLVRFEKLNNDNGNPVTTLLDYPNKWYIGSQSGCSCTFRHLLPIELGFSEPVDWFKEEQISIDATKDVYNVISSLLQSGNNIDCIDQWEGAAPEDIKILTISFATVTRNAFRFFENHKFLITN